MLISKNISLNKIKRHLGNESGQTLSIVLVLLAIGGLLIGINLNYAGTSLKNSHVIDEKVMGSYAADAGIENTLWYFKRNLIPPSSLTENINDMEVNIEIEEKGIVTYANHNEYLGIVTTTEWVESVGAYKYTISVFWQPGSGSPDIKIDEVGTILPLGFEYRAGSVSSFPENLSTNPPGTSSSESGAQKLTWGLPSPKPSVSVDDPVRTQIFYIDEIVTGSIVNSHYSWVEASRTDISIVSELTGASYKLIARATRPEDGKVTAEISAGLTIKDGVPYITSWMLLK